MSSILEALKKLEDESPRRTGDNTSLPRTPGVKKTLRRWEITSGRFAPVLWGALSVVVLAAAVWLLLYMRSPHESPAPSAGLPIAPSQSVAEQKPQSGSVSKPEPVVRQSTGSSLADKRRRRVPPTGAKTRTVPVAPARTKKGVQQQKSVLPPPVKRADPQTGAELPVLKTGLELQAVSWAPSPANRIAVINGSIIREGGSIEGYSVTRIDEDQVVVRKDLSQWRLIFNLKK